MSTHIEASEGDIADAVLLPGDPLRAQHIAERFLENARCYNRVRGMLGFTGTYRGVPVSVQGTGMGQPSLSIYATELFRFYGVQKAVRVGTCGALRADGKLREVVIASGACSDSALLSQRFGRLHFAPVADFALLNAARLAAEREGVPCRVGLVASSDLFYDDNENWRLWAKYGVLGVEMESAELYTLAARFGRQALAILTVSDNVATGEGIGAQERENGFDAAARLALEAATALPAQSAGNDNPGSKPAECGV
ncbi:purine-nucleoside phosphorylase [Treponema endosymbiont of Eucomonympha sp.]|uniref:purine-nucleoside phosphorylase n=1 Tax=Treponema endosymbiont of Eucomonympha sp. TaxID=1580831 RepID=UPI0007847412|nr:purine-nucleoside phosphorylase [Treponema endosymbiont of Eucomonympha sp.]